jgi:hypothetical protein
MAEQNPASWLDLLPYMQRLYARDRVSWNLDDWRTASEFYEAAAEDFHRSALEAARELVTCREIASLWRQLAQSLLVPKKGRPFNSSQRKILKKFGEARRPGTPATVPGGLVEFIVSEMTKDHRAGTPHTTREWAEAAVRVYEREKGQRAPFSASTLANLLVGKNPATRRARRNGPAGGNTLELESAFLRIKRCA